MERDYNISVIRILAMISIVLCHIFQAKNIGIAFWLNVGVQIFLFMSGYLYGKKQINNTWEWIKRQCKKILIPYYIYIFLMLIIYMIFSRNSLTIKNVMSLVFVQQLINQFPLGLNHLWFIPVILICYLITPFLQKQIKEKSGKYKALISVFIIFYIETFFYQTSIDIRVSNIVCYVIGYLLADMSIKDLKNRKVLEFIIIILAIISNCLKIFMLGNGYNRLIKIFLELVIKNSHLLLGTAIFILAYKLFNIINKHLNQIIIKIIDILDKYCYHIYLTHHVFIIGPLTMINITQNIFLNITIIIVNIIISSYILEKLTYFIKKGLKEI